MLGVGKEFSCRSMKYIRNRSLIWFMILFICVSYLGAGGLYNPDIMKYNRHQLSSLGEARGVDMGCSDMLMADSTSGLALQIRNVRTGNSEKCAEVSWVLTAAVLAMLLDLFNCISAFAGSYEEWIVSCRCLLLKYIHGQDGKKRTNLHCY